MLDKEVSEVHENGYSSDGSQLAVTMAEEEEKIN